MHRYALPLRCNGSCWSRQSFEITQILDLMLCRMPLFLDFWFSAQSGKSLSVRITTGRVMIFVISVSWMDGSCTSVTSFESRYLISCSINCCFFWICSLHSCVLIDFTTKNKEACKGVLSNFAADKAIRSKFFNQQGQKWFCYHQKIKASWASSAFCIHFWICH